MIDADIFVVDLTPGIAKLGKKLLHFVISVYLMLCQ